MLTLNKLLVLILILAAVWYGFRVIGRMQRKREEIARREGDAPARAKGTGKRQGQDAEDMAQCALCGIYVTPDAAKCGKPGCPQVG